jgi:molybdopterin molybdotransferase
MISFDEATALVLDLARPVGTEDVPLEGAHRRILAAPVAARVAAPPADVSTMDGYAVRVPDVEVLPARLRVAGESLPGSVFGGPLEPGCCVRIFTGAAIPPGADRVVMQEVVRREGDFATFEQPLGAPLFIRSKGSDFAEGEVLLQPGTFMGPRQLVAAAAADVGMLTVRRRPRVRVLSTGDELVAPGTAADRQGAIPESVSVGVAALAEEWGAKFVGSSLLPDRLPELEKAAAVALTDADLVVVTGGASVGERDFAKQMFAAHGMELMFSKVAIKPGKPVWLGRVGDRIVLGLPGNPTSAMVTARLFLAPLLAGLSGREPAAALRWRQLRLAGDNALSGDREAFARGREQDDGVWIASNQDSGAQKTLAGSELLVRLPAGDVATPAGCPVDVLDF